MMTLCNYMLLDETLSYDPSALKHGVKKLKYHDDEKVIFEQLLHILGGTENVAYLDVTDIDVTPDGNYVLLKYDYVTEADFQRARRIKINRLYAFDDDDY